MRVQQKREATEAEAKALASALRLRILRICLDEALTNKEIAARLGANPATILHHVRTLVANGFLEPEAERRGTRGAREIPYRATGKSWHMSVGDPEAAAAGTDAMIEAFLQEVRLVAKLEEVNVARIGLRLNAENHEEFQRRLSELFNEFVARDPDPDGKPMSVFFAMHEDVGRA